MRCIPSAQRPQWIIVARESTNRFVHFSLISWFIAKHRGRTKFIDHVARQRRKERKRAIVGENPAGPFVYEYVLSGLFNPHHGLRLYIRTVTTWGTGENYEGGTVSEFVRRVNASQPRGTKHLTARPYFTGWILRFYLSYDRHLGNGGFTFMAL